MAATANERKRQERKRKREAGLVKAEFWLTPEQRQKFKELLKDMA